LNEFIKFSSINQLFMDINKIDKQVNGKFNKTEAASKGKQTSPVANKGSSANTDKVTLSNVQFRSSEQLFVKIELEKLHYSKAERFKEIKSQLTAYKKG